MELTRVTAGSPGAAAEPTGRADTLDVHVVDNGDLRLAFLPGVGGRLISLRCGGAELLWRNPEYLDDALRTVRPRSTWAPLDGGMGSWANVGGAKTWPAPQGWSGPDEWPGPPDPVLDSGEWTITAEPAAEGFLVRMVSPDDPYTGVRATREFAVPARGTTFTQRTTFTNVVDRPVRWSVWEVAQVDAEAFAHDRRGADPSADAEPAGSPDAGLWVGVRGDAEPVHLVETWGQIAVAPPEGGRRRVVVDDVVAKVGFRDAAGTIELRRPDGAGVRWDVELPAGDYPDGGCQVELWMQYPTAEPLEGPGSLHPAARLVELEVLTPLTLLAPGETVTQTITWTVTPGSGPA